MRLLSHPLRPAVCLLLLGISIYRLLPVFSQSKDSIKNFIPLRGGVVACEGHIDEKLSANSRARFIVGDLKCMKDGVMLPLSGKMLLAVRRGSVLDGAVKSDLVGFRAYVRHPRDFRNFNRLKFENYCFSKSIGALGYAYKSSVKIIRNDAGAFERVIGDWRTSVKAAIRGGLDDPAKAGIIGAFVLGDKEDLSKKHIDDFRSLGIIHILVVSGLNITVFAAVCWWVVVVFGSFMAPAAGQIDMRPIAALLSVVAAWLYVALTGFGIPAVRAGIISSVYIGSILLVRKPSSWDSLALAVIIILGLYPNSLFDISFQLTFVAVGGILTVSKLLLGKNLDDRFPKKLLIDTANAFIVSMGAFAGVFPLLAYHFGSVPIFGPFVTVLVAPLVNIGLVPFSIVSAIITPIFPKLGSILFGLLSRPVGILLSITKVLAKGLKWGILDIEFNYLNTLTFYVLIALIIYLLVLMRHGGFFRKARENYKILAAGFIIVCGGFGASMTQGFEIFEGEMAVTFLDVGQGSSVVVRLPNGSVTVVDGGGVDTSNFDLGRVILDPFLNKIGAEKVDRIMVTHPHPDHFKGLGHIVQNFSPDRLVVGNFPVERLSDEGFGEWNSFLGLVERSGVKVEQVQPSVWEEDGVEFQVFSPPRDIPESWANNDTSMVLRLQYGDVSFLITGDVESAAERYIAENDFEIASTVMQIPHHGSSVSSSNPFLDLVSPQYGVIQVGTFNKFGLPDEEVISRFEERGIKVFRTDTDGAVMFVTDGECLKVFSAAKR